MRVRSIYFVLFCFFISSCCCCPFISKKDKPVALIVSAPSGCGKDTMINSLVERNHDLLKILSVTTRNIRSNEKQDFDYHFMTGEEFSKIRKENGLLQEAYVFGNYRGILKSDIDAAIKVGKNIILNVNYDAFVQLKKSLKNDFNVVSIFLLPPSKETVMNRLSVRGTETKEEVEMRMKLMVSEGMKGFDKYDYQIIADTREQTLHDVEDVYNVAKIKARKNSVIKLGNELVS